MSKERTDPITDEDGEEHHPAFGIISVNHVHATPGEVLFQSDVQHPEYIVLRVHQATRQRDLKHDWVHPGKLVAEVSMSMAQFASFVASGGTEGVPATINYTEGIGHRPGLNPGSRFAVTAGEVRASAEQAYGDIAEAFQEYQQALTIAGAGAAAARKAALRKLQASITNAVPNVAYAAKQLDKHAETVVERSRADIEAMVLRMAERTGIAPSAILELDAPAGPESA